MEVKRFSHVELINQTDRIIFDLKFLSDLHITS
jgi:hypothetical protein